MKISKKAKKLFFTELVILVFMALVFAILDLSLDLGKFHGFVFSLYILYFSVIVIFVNTVLSLINLFRERKKASRRFITVGAIVSLLGFGLSYLGNLF